MLSHTLPLLDTGTFTGSEKCDLTLLRAVSPISRMEQVNQYLPVPHQNFWVNCSAAAQAVLARRARKLGIVVVGGRYNGSMRVWVLRRSQRSDFMWLRPKLKGISHYPILPSSSASGGGWRDGL